MAAGRRILVAYLVYFAAIGAAFPYLPVYYREIGLGFERIGLLTAIQAMTQLAMAPVWGGLADRYPRTRLTLPLAALVASAGAAILFRAGAFEIVLVGSVVLYAGLAGIGPSLDARTLETLGPDRRDRYGQVRAFGSLAFVVATWGVGLLLDAEGAISLFWVYIPFLLATAAVTSTIPRRPGLTRSVSLWRGARHVVSAPGMAGFFGGFLLVWSALAAANAFYSIQVVALGGTTSMVGLIWAVASIIEVPIMYGFPRLARRFRTEDLLVLGAIGFAVRAALSGLARDPAWLIAIAPLEGISFAFVFVGGVTLVASRAPAGIGGTAQGVFSAFSGLATIIGSAGGGAIAAAFGIPGLFAVCAMVGLAGAAVVGMAVESPKKDAATATVPPEDVVPAPGTPPPEPV